MIGIILGVSVGLSLHWIFSFFWDKRKQRKKEQAALKIQEDKNAEKERIKEIESAVIAKKLKNSIEFLPNSHIGVGAKIGANCVIYENIPDYATAVLPKTRIISKPS